MSSLPVVQVEEDNLAFRYNFATPEIVVSVFSLPLPLVGPAVIHMRRGNLHARASSPKAHNIFHLLVRLHARMLVGT